jgi:predicted metal-binding membrane protein
MENADEDDWRRVPAPSASEPSYSLPTSSRIWNYLSRTSGFSMLVLAWTSRLRPSPLGVGAADPAIRVGDQRQGVRRRAQSLIAVKRVIAERAEPRALGTDRVASPGASPTPSSLLRLTREASGLLLFGAALWAVVAWLAANMGFVPGSMGLGLPAFVGVWALMMAAMMVPAVAPVAAAYSRSVKEHRRRRLVEFASGYLLAWAGSGLPAFAGALLVDRLSGLTAFAARAVAAGALCAVAAYQLTPLKRMCLDHCRSPLSQLLHYAAFRGTLRDLRVGLHHGAFCLGCCWALMLVLIALGTMNVFVMLSLVAVVVLEKYAAHGVALSRLVAVVAVALAVIAAAVPQASLGAPAISM